MLKQGQKLTFSGVGAHHQNGRAEKRIRDLQDLARTSLIQANRMWSDAISAHLWPYALRHANDSINKTHFKGKDLTPIELFSGSDVIPNITQSHPFGCPAYALDGIVQSGQKAPKWSSRARMAVYLGASPQHASTVGLLLSLTTGLISPQFHVRYDDTFQTLRKPSYVVPSLWQKLAGFKKAKSTNKTEAKVLEFLPNIPNSENRSQDIVRANPDADVFELPADIEESYRNKVDTEQDENDQNTVDSLPDTPERNPRVTRSGRVSVFPRRFDDYVALSANTPETEGDPDILESAFAASSDPDVSYLHKALKAPDSEEFIKAMDKEVQAHEEGQNWIIVDRDDIPEGKAVGPSVWAMRRKRDIATQTVYKWKARLNFHGGKHQKGIDFWETYAPVASWAAIWLVIMIAVFGVWYTKQLDFVLAFPQAPVETELYMEIPQGYAVKGDPKKKALKLINNLYGQRQAGRVWNKFLTKGLVSIGFVQSKHDEYIFWRNNVIIVIYTDDTIVTGRLEADVDQAIKDIGSIFEITHKPKVEDFLGVKIDRDVVTGTVSFTQPHLIDSIIRDLGLNEDSTSRSIPALVSVVIHKHENSPAHEADWRYRSLIGKLNYLAKSTRPDIEYAVHQCARFTSDPREEHTKAVKLIGRYLLATRDKGMVCKPDRELMTCYVDANFSGDWLPETAMDDSATALSRSGYFLRYSGCPVVWASKLQTEIALSSTESEYISLSQSLREVIPLMCLIKEMKDNGFDLPVETPEVHCKLFEDYNGALEMAQTPKMRPRTKHLNIKYHHFRGAVEEKLVTIHRVSTEEQMADIFTKPLGLSLFAKFRMMIMGW